VMNRTRSLPARADQTGQGAAAPTSPSHWPWLRLHAVREVVRQSIKVGAAKGLARKAIATVAPGRRNASHRERPDENERHTVELGLQSVSRSRHRSGLASANPSITQEVPFRGRTQELLGRANV